MAPILSTAVRRLGEAVGGIVSIAITMAVIVTVIYLRQAGAGLSSAGSTPPAGPGVAAERTRTDEPQIGATGASPTPDDASPTPDLASVAPAATSSPASAKPSPAPTVGPKPTRDTAPEPTQIIYVASGTLGETIANHDVSIRVAPAVIPAAYDGRGCPAEDEPLAYSVTFDWTKYPTVLGPVLEIGANPIGGNWSVDPITWNHGVTGVVVLCHRPGDTMVIHAYSGIDGSQPSIEFWWTIR